MPPVEVAESSGAVSIGGPIRTARSPSEEPPQLARPTRMTDDPPSRPAAGQHGPRPRPRQDPRGPAPRARRPPPERSRTNSLLAAAGVAGVLTVAGVAGIAATRDDGDGAASTTSTPQVPPAVAFTEPTASTAAPPPPGVIPPVPPSERTVLTDAITRDMSGPEVERLQRRLAELKFNPGPIDGSYGTYTIQAVWAFQKLVLGVPRDRVGTAVTDSLWQRMQDELDVQPRRAASAGRISVNHTEVYLPEQVVVFFMNDEPALIAHISSGTEEIWRDEVTIDPGEQWNEDGTEPVQRGIMALGHTPGGVFEYNRFVEGRRQSVLGGMWNPAYFNFGIAIHGAQNVPEHPASHACIRVNMFLSEIFWDYIANGDQVFVWNMAGDEPEDAPNDYPWNQLDPDSPLNTTTTTTTTTTVPPTTVPATTAPPATTEPAPAATTAVDSGTTVPPPPASPDAGTTPATAA